MTTEDSLVRWFYQSSQYLEKSDVLDCRNLVPISTTPTTPAVAAAASSHIRSTTSATTSVASRRVGRSASSSAPSTSGEPTTPARSSSFVVHDREARLVLGVEIRESAGSAAAKRLGAISPASSWSTSGRLRGCGCRLSIVRDIIPVSKAP